MTDIEVRWEDFDRMLVIKRLRSLVGSWFNIQLNFTDHKGFLRGVPDGKFFNPLTEVSKAISASERGFNDCMNHARKTTVDAMSSKKPQLSRTTAGFSSISVPIRIDSQFLGCVYADGFITEESKAEQAQLIKNYLERVFPEESAKLIASLDRIPVLGKVDVEYLTELVEFVVAEILEINKNLFASKRKIEELSEELGSRYEFRNMIGKSAPMQNLYRMIERVAKSDSTVLVQGENGTGKELIARALHYGKDSPRRGKKFIVINCGAFNDNLLESELFGHVKGAFTGAIKDKKGLFEEADGGTLFLDEIGETSLSMQVKMLRVLQNSTFTPVGATKERSADVRVLAATNRNLAEMVKEGSFREDLYYRLNVINLVVPPLRDRKEDITLLLEFFLDRQAKASGEPIKQIDKDCLKFLMNHEWPGNVRELENEIERLCVLAGGDIVLTEDLLSPRIKTAAAAQKPGSAFQAAGKLKDAIETLEKAMILEGLRRTHWNKSQLAKELGISRAGLIMKVEKYGLEKRSA